MNWLVICIVFLYVMLCVLSVRKFKFNMQEMLFKFVLMIFIPVLGPLLLIILKKKENSKHDGSLDYIIHGELETKENMMFLNPINKQDELNKIPMEEVLNINNFKMRRKFIMDTMQDDDVLEYLWCLKQALGNEDVETVHYASAVIMETQKKISDSVIAMKKRYDEEPQDKKNIEDYEDILEKIIFSGVYDDINLHRYYEEYKKLSDSILETDFIEEKYLLNRVRVDFKIGDYVHAKSVCERYRRLYPDSEDMIISNMKYYVMTYDKENLKEFLRSIEDMKNSLTYESLKYVEFLS